MSALATYLAGEREGSEREREETPLVSTYVPPLLESGGDFFAQSPDWLTTISTCRVNFDAHRF